MMSETLTGGNVVSMDKVRARTLFPSLGRVETYWEALRDGRAMPSRSEVDPRGISDVLEHAFILEKVAPGVARIRLAGMHLNELMAMEVRGMPLTAMFLPEARRELQKVIERVLDTPAVVRLTLGADTGFTRPALEGQMMLLPLRDANGAPTRVLGVLETRGRIGRGPRRFMIRDMETKDVREDPANRQRPDIGGFERLPEPRPVLKPVAPAQHTGADSFAPRTRDLARQIAARQAERAPDAVGKIATQRKHLRLVHDSDLV